MSLYSYSTISSSSSSSKRSESSNSYRLRSSSSSSITTVSGQLDTERQDDEQWPISLTEENNWHIEKNISLKDQQSTKTGCILKATMTKEHILLCQSSSTQSTILPGQHISMKVVFKF